METHLRVQSEDPLIIRAGPGKNYDEVGTFAHGTVIIMEEKNESWIKHYRGWSEWSEGAFARYTPQYTKLSTRSKSKRKPKLAAKPRTISYFTIGQTVQCRDDSNQKWMNGTITSLNPFQVKVEGSSLDHPWKQVRKLRKWYVPEVGDQIEIIRPFTTNNANNKVVLDVGDVLIVNQISSKTGSILGYNDKLEKKQWISKRDFANIKLVASQAPYCRTKIAPKVLSTPSSLASAYSTPATSESGSSMVSVDSYNWRTYVQTMPDYKQKAKKYVTLQQCVIQASVDPRSEKLLTLPENIEIQIDSVCKERARMIYPLKGWIWMSSPQGPLVRSLDFHPRGYDNHVDFVSEHHFLKQPCRVTTTAPCVIRSAVNCQSDRLRILPVGTSLYVESVYKQRACVHANVNGDDVYGWCWLSSPRGDLVEVSVKPTVVLTGPMVNDDDIQTTRNHLGVYGIQIPDDNITRLDDMTVELKVSSHEYGKIALKQIRKVNGKQVKLAWKPSYLAYRNWRKQFGVKTFLLSLPRTISRV